MHPLAKIVALLVTLAVSGLGTMSLRPEQPLAVPFYTSVDCTPHWLTSSESKSRSLHTVAEFTLIDQTGHPFQRRGLAGKIHIADFFFTTCSGLCPALTHNLSMLAHKFAADTSVVFVSYSVTPEIDSVARLREYATQYRIDPKQWHLLTGDRKKIYELARTSYFAEAAKGGSSDTGAFLHTEHFVLVDTYGRVRGIYNGTLMLENERLIEDIATIEREE